MSGRFGICSVASQKPRRQTRDEPNEGSTSLEHVSEPGRVERQNGRCGCRVEQRAAGCRQSMGDRGFVDVVSLCLGLRG
jgi:hypothetical protein